MSDLLLNIRLRATDEYSGALAGMEGKMASLRAATGLLAGVIGVFGATTIVEAIKAAINYNSMLQKVADNTTLGAKGTAEMDAAIKKLAAISPANLEDLANAYMHITNFGFDAHDATTILTEAMKSAVSTGSKTSDVANALAQAMKEFGIKGRDAAKAMNTIHDAAALGNGTLEQFVTGAGKALQMAGGLGLHLNEVAAALSTATRHGETFRLASNHMALALSQLVHPTKAVKDEINLLRIQTGVNLADDFTTAGLKTKGLTGVLKDLEKATGGNLHTLQLLFPGYVTAKELMMLLGIGAGDYKTILNQLTQDYSGKLNPTQAAWNAISHTTSFLWGVLKNNIQLAAIALGDAFLPYVNKFLAAAVPLVKELASWVKAHGDLAAKITLSVTAIGLLTGGLSMLKLAFGFSPLVEVLSVALKGLLGPIGLMFAAVSVGVVAWKNNWGDIQGKVKGAWTEMGPIFKSLAGLGEVFSTIKDAFAKGGLVGAFEALPKAFGQIKTAIAGVKWDTLLGDLGKVMSQLGTWITSEVPQLVTKLSAWGTAFVNWVGPQIPKLLTAAAGLSSSLFTWISGVVPQISTKIGGWVGAFLSWAGPVASQFLQKAGSLGQQLFDWITTTTPQIVSKIASWGKEFVSWAVPAGTNMVKELTPLITKLLVSIGNATGPIVDKIKDWGKAFVAWIQPATLQFLAHWPGLLDHVLNNLDGAIGPIAAKLGKWALAFVQWIGPAIPVIAKALLGISAAAVVFIVETVLVLSTHLSKWAQAFWDWAAPVAVKAIAGLADAVVKLNDWIKTNAMAFGGMLADKFVKAFTAWIDPVGTQIQAGFGGIGAKLSLWMTATLGNIVGKMVEWSGGFTNWIPPMTTQLLDAMRKLPGQIISALGDLSHLLVDAGGKIISGLIAGIQGKLGDLGNTLGNVGKFVTDHKGPPEKDAVMLVASGQLIMDGLMKGIANRQGALGSQLAGVSAGIQNGISGSGGLSAGGIGGAGGGLVVNLNFQGGVTVNDRAHLRELADQVSKQIMANLRSQAVLRPALS